MTSTQLQPCGTDAAHARHVRHGEDPCEACRIARNEAQNRRRRRRLRLTDPDANLDTAGDWDDTAFEQAACHPWDGSHDSRNEHETERDFNTRLAAARLTCRGCPAFTDCRRRARHLVANHLRIDGIFAGHHYRYRGTE